jgi:DNA-binding beta-propeller fold protein YncE
VCRESSTRGLIAGQKLTQSATTAATDRNVTWDWQGWIRAPAQGSQRDYRAHGYTYKVVYARAAAVQLAWARLGGIPLTGNPGRMEVTLWQEWSGVVTRWDSRGQGLGRLEPERAARLRPGRARAASGRWRGAEMRRQLAPAAIRTYAGTIGGYSGDGGQAGLARISQPFGLAAGADGSLYIADSGNHRVRRVGPIGVISTVAGTGTAGSSGRQWAGNTGRLNGPIDVAVGPDGSVYYRRTEQLPGTQGDAGWRDQHRGRQWPVSVQRRRRPRPRRRAWNHGESPSDRWHSLHRRSRQLARQAGRSERN